MRLQGKNALVTGASKGIGRAIALAFAHEEAALVATARNAEELASLQTEIAGAGGTCHTIVQNLEQEGAVDNVLAYVETRLGALDILVNNAGIGSSRQPMLVSDYDDAFWNLLLYVNLTVPYLFIRKVLPEMKARQYGRIVNVASINGKVPSPYGCAYAASKHGLLGLTKTVAVENVAHGITANAICPGPVVSKLNDARIEFDAKRAGVSFEEQEKTTTGLGRRLTPAEVAPLAVYLASADSATMTGQALNIDAGNLTAA